MTETEYICALRAITAANIKVEAMKAANAQRADVGAGQAYGESHFFDVETELYNETQKLIQGL